MAFVGFFTSLIIKSFCFNSYYAALDIQIGI